MTGAMKPNSAAAFVLAGLSLWLSEAPPSKVGAHRLGALCAMVMGGIGVLTVAEYLLGWDLGIDRLLARDQGTRRMGIDTALTFALLSVPLLSHNRAAVLPGWL